MDYASAMRTTRARPTLVLIATVLMGGLSSCGRWLPVAAGPEQDWEEVFNFEMQPGTMNPAEAEEAVGDAAGPGLLAPGSVVHRGSVAAPSGRVDFYSYRAVDPEVGQRPMFCTAMTAGSMASAGCGDAPEVITQPIHIGGESWGSAWRSVEFAVVEDVVRVEGTAEDGTVYTVSPLTGFGYIEWPDERGSLELVAYDGDGRELGRTIAGLDR